MAAGFVPPPYPYERLDGLRPAAAAHDGGAVDLSIGTPCDPAPAAVIAALGASDTERGYPPSIGTDTLRTAAAGWMSRRLGITVDAATEVAACVGTKEFVATTPHWLRLRSPERDTVLYPAISYPTYEMGATLAGCRAVPVPVDHLWRLDVNAIDPADAQRAVCLWVNTPGNPAGGLDDLADVARWGRANGVPVLSDECYIEFTWDGARQTILASGGDGVVAVHSLSKRSNAAGLRVGVYAGDADLVGYLREVRKHVGMLVPGPVQAAAAVAFDDDTHVEEQRQRYRERLELFAAVLDAAGFPVARPGGGFYLWAAVPDGDDWAATAWLAEHGGCLVSPGELYGEAGRGHIRVALVQPQDRLELVASRLSGEKYEPSRGTRTR